MSAKGPGADTENVSGLAPDFLAASARVHRVDSSGLAWLSVHGAVLLALRHPGITGTPREILMEFVSELGEALVAWGILTPEGLAAAVAAESDSSPHGD